MVLNPLQSGLEYICLLIFTVKEDTFPSIALQQPEGADPHPASLPSPAPLRSYVLLPTLTLDG